MSIIIIILNAASKEEEEKNQVLDFGFFGITIEDIDPDSDNESDVKPSKND